MAKNTDFKEKSAEELTELLAEKREALRALRFSTVSRSVKDTSEPRQIRADIARIMTALSTKTA